jgi:Tol biopolymer transport system component
MSLYVIDLNNGELAHWAIDGQVASSLVDSWSPKRQELLITDYTGRGTQAQVVSRNGTTDRLPFLEGIASAYAWSPNGEQVAFSYRNQIYSQSVDGTDLSQVTHFALDDGGTSPTHYVSAIHPSWSPDGEKLVFALWTDDSATLYIVNRDGTGLQALADHLPGKSREPKWSPDGTKIAFLYSEEADHPYTVWLMNPDGGEAKQLLEPHPSGDFARGVSSLAWAPDGRRLAFFSGWAGPCTWLFRESETCSQSLYLMDVDGTNLTKLTHRVQYQSNLAWIY